MIFVIILFLLFNNSFKLSTAEILPVKGPSHVASKPLGDFSDYTYINDIKASRWREGSVIQYHIYTKNTYEWHRTRSFIARAVRDWQPALGTHVLLKEVDGPGNVTINLINRNSLINKTGISDITGYTDFVYDKDGYITSATIYVSDNLTFNQTLDCAVHEMGHACGIVFHSADENDVMAPNLNFYRGLSKRDLTTMALIYSNPSSQDGLELKLEQLNE